MHLDKILIACQRPVPAWATLLVLLLGLLATGLLIGAGSANQASYGHAIVVFMIVALGLAAAATAFSVMSSQATALDEERPNTGAPTSADIRQGSAKLQSELTNVMTLIRDRIGKDRRYAASLAAAQHQLENLPTPEQVQLIVELLIEENHRIHSDSLAMSKKLEASKLQIEGLQARLERASQAGLQDPLTSASNRREFDQKLKAAIQNAKKQHTPLSIILTDLDSFKNINDNFGHQVGDEVLKHFTSLMKKSVRDCDTIARIGGEEFAIILPYCNSHEAQDLADHVRSRLSLKSLIIRRTSQDIGIITASFGVTQLIDGEDTEDLIQRADEALYEAKRSGRNRVVLY